MKYLVEFEAYDPGLGATRVLRFASDGYTTAPGDVPPDAHFDERVTEPGNFSQSVFSQGRTNGESTASFGYLELALTDADSSQSLDYLSTLAVDGRRVTIYSLDDLDSPWSSRRVVFLGTMEQIELTWTRARVRIRDRLAELRKSIQPTLYKGTTTAGDMVEAEGTAGDLKDRPKPLLFGAARNIPALLANRFSNVFQVSSRAIHSVSAARDRGVGLTATQDYPTLSALVSATIADGRFATCLAQGLVRTGIAPRGDFTVDASEGAPGERSAALVVRRMLEFAGFSAGTHFSAGDFSALHGKNGAEVGIWIDANERDLLQACSTVLSSVGGYLVPDRLGLLRTGRLEAPTLSEVSLELDRSVVLTDEPLQRLATDDEGRGVPTSKVTVQYAYNYLIQQASALDNTAATADVKTFVSSEFRSAVAEDPSIKTRNLLAPDLTFSTLFSTAADAQAEANRRLALYGVRRDRYRVRVKASVADEAQLGVVVRLTLPRFDLGAGRLFRIIGREENYTRGVVTLELYG